jgi:hypothetical protein
MSWIRTSIAAVVALAAPACITGISNSDCPDQVYYRLTDGNYTSTQAESAELEKPFPHTDQVGKTMVIDRTAGTVSFTYQSEGSEVIELWNLGEITDAHR